MTHGLPAIAELLVVYSGSWLLAIITPKYKTILKIFLGLVKSCYMLPVLVVDRTQASECSEQENFGENDRQTIK